MPDHKPYNFAHPSAAMKPETSGDEVPVDNRKPSATQQPAYMAPTTGLGQCLVQNVNNALQKMDDVVAPVTTPDPSAFVTKLCQ